MYNLSHSHLEGEQKTIVLQLAGTSVSYQIPCDIAKGYFPELHVLDRFRKKSKQWTQTRSNVIKLMKGVLFFVEPWDGEHPNTPPIWL